MASESRKGGNGRESRKGGNGEDTNSAGDGGNTAVRLLPVGVDILPQVLRLLRLRVLFQCKSVCKAWYSIISDLDFRNKYLLDSSKSSMYVELETRNDHRGWNRCHYSKSCYFPRFIPDGELPTGPIFDEISSKNICFPVHMDLLGTSAGLLLLLDGSCQEYLVYNPLTGSMNEIPSAVPQLPFNVVNNLVYLFECREPKHSSESYGYEILLIDSVSLSPAVQMYKSENPSGLWVTKQATWQIPQGYIRLGPKNTSRVMVGEKLYWTLTKLHLGVFDTITGMMDFVTLPQKRDCLTPILSVDPSGGLLCVAWNNVGFHVYLLRCPPGSYNWGTGTTEDRRWTWKYKEEYADILKDNPDHLSELNSGDTASLMLYRENLILLCLPGHHVFYDLVSRKLIVPDGNTELLCQWGRGLIARYELPSWPFRLPG